MTDSISNVLILGGGVAGMEAARTFENQAAAVHLVEKSNALGGHAAKWACMATDTCENCGACLSLEMAGLVMGQPNVTVYLDTSLNQLNPLEKGYEARLTGDKTVFVDKVILATGFSPFDPKDAPSLNSDTLDRVVTTAQLNTYLKEETFSDRFNGKKDPKIAFFQCVGSRNREKGRDYCSQVCCKISMRHAKKITHLMPDASVTLFYMDLQVIGKEIRTLYREISENISLVQGVPAEILENRESNMLSIVTEEDSARVEKSFDMIVLSIGMQPADASGDTFKTIDIKPNSWGFFNTDETRLTKDVRVAGCAHGPKNILSSIQQGKIAAHGIIEDLGLKRPGPKSIAVLGSGRAAVSAADNLSDRGYKPVIFGAAKPMGQPGEPTVPDHPDMINVTGTAGSFSILCQSGEKKDRVNCAAIINAQEPIKSRTHLDNLKNELLSLEDLAVKINDNKPGLPEKIAILLDYTGPENKTNARLALETAIKAVASGKRIFVLLNKILVDGALGQRLYDKARKIGVRFLRFNTTDDLAIKDKKNGFEIQLKETTLPALTLNLKCDFIALPHRIEPSPLFKKSAALLRDSLDSEGYLQSANVRHRLVSSPRKGVFFIGSGHDEVDDGDLFNELDDISASLWAMNSDQHDPTDAPEIEINPGKCARCMTCIRCCPHAAIVLSNGSQPQILPDACFSCHLCVASCPMYAISSDNLSIDQIVKKANTEKVALLACERSAALAADHLTLKDHVTLVRMPCTCRINPDILLALLLNKVSKVIVAGCHEQNCRSEKGATTAKKSVNSALKIPGIDPDNILWQPVAANETRKLERILSKV